MRVVNEYKWRRTKMVLAAIVALTIVVCIGGLEGTEPMPAPEIAVMLFPVLFYLIWNITKDYN